MEIGCFVVFPLGFAYIVKNLLLLECWCADQQADDTLGATGFRFADKQLISGGTD